MKGSDEKDIIIWDDKLKTGIDCIDDQHKRLLLLCNDLHKACLNPRETVARGFVTAIKEAVEYTQTHFKYEERMMRDEHYPSYAIHKKEHDTFILEIIARAKDFDSGAKVTAPPRFARFLYEWILHHIAFVDVQFGAFMSDKNRQNNSFRSNH